jgi:pyruvate/2-oxoglutarate/acetoin dehydrogenase E1 component
MQKTEQERVADSSLTTNPLPLSYKSSLTAAMHELARDPKVIFVGYGVRVGGQAAGTLKGIPAAQLLETPVAENLMLAIAIGQALKGYKPVVYFERFDFILNAMDAIVNHLDKMEELSSREFSPAILIRVVVGNTKKPLYTGVTHTQDFTKPMRQMVSFPVVRLEKTEQIGPAYREAYEDMRARPGLRRSTMLVELKDLI